MQDLISVIIPVFNVEKYLSKCIDSVISQTYENIEIILVDDGSADSSGEICEFYKEKDKRIQVIHKINGGLSDARNSGLEIARGEYVVFIDSDDYVDANYLMKMYLAISRMQADLVICNYCLVDDKGKSINERVSPIKNEILTGRDIEYKICEKNGDYFVVAWNKMYKSSLWKTLRFPVGKINEDEFVIYKILEMSHKVITIKDELYYYVRRGDSIMHQKYNIKRLDVWDAYLERVEFYFKNRMDILANKTLSVFFGILANAYENIDLKNKSNREYINNKRKNILRKISIYKSSFNFKNKVKYIMCTRTIKMYITLRKIGKIIYGK